MSKFDKKPELKKEVVQINKSDIDKFMESMESVSGNIGLALEDLSWINQGTAFSEEPDEFDRKNIIQRSRDDYKRYPIYKQAVELDKGFILGKGISRPESDNPFIQRIIDYIWDARENKKTFTGFMAMENIIEQKTIIGELFFKIYINETTGENIVRIERDTKKIIDVITAPGDKDCIQYYKYKTINVIHDFKTGKKKNETKEFIIPDINNEDEADINKHAESSYNKNTKVRLYGFLVSFGNAAEVNGLRGYPVYMQTLKWFKAHKEVAEDSATMLKAKSRYAWQNKFPEGVGKPVVEAMMTAAKSITPGGNVNSTTPAAGSELYVNEKYMKKEPIDIKHDPKMFEGTSKILMQAIASGTGKSEHYYGNPSNANLATATAMELPVLKRFQAQQQEFAEIIEWVMKFLILKVIKIKGVELIKDETMNDDFDLPTNEEDKDGKKLLNKFLKQVKNSTWENLNISVYMPDIVSKETAVMIKAINESILAGSVDERVGSRAIYSLLGVRNIDDIISEQYGDYDEEDEVDEAQKEKDMDEETERVVGMVKQRIDEETKIKEKK